MKERLEFKKQDFEPLYVHGKDKSAVGAFTEGDLLYVLDNSASAEDERGEFYGAPEIIQTFVREIRVRLHEVSRKPFVDISGKLGKELVYLDKEDGVLVHARHRAFESVRRRNEESGGRTGSASQKGHSESGSDFTNAYVRLAQAIHPPLKESASSEAFEFPRYLIDFVELFVIRPSNVTNNALSFTFEDSRKDMVLHVGGSLCTELFKVGLLKANTNDGYTELKVQDQARALKIFDLFKRYAKGAGSMTKEMFLKRLSDERRTLWLSIPGISEVKGKGWEFTVIFTM